MRDVFLVEYKIGNRSSMGCYGILATSVFRRFVPWDAGTAEVGNIISLWFENRHKTREYTPEVAILGLMQHEPLRIGGTSWNP
jgi:hypothetical protein